MDLTRKTKAGLPVHAGFDAAATWKTQQGECKIFKTRKYESRMWQRQNLFESQNFVSRLFFLFF